METMDIMKFQNRTDKSIRLLAFLEAKEGHGKELEEILLEVVEPTRRESGNIAYVLHRSNDNPDELLFDEIWTDKVSLEEHFKKPYMEALDSKIEHLLSKEVEIKEYSEVMMPKI
jgi:quinol monooxygenase YgiN